MKKLLLFTITFFATQINLFSQEEIRIKPGPVKLNLQNVCEVMSDVIICNGIDSNGIVPTFGASPCSYNLPYVFQDSLTSFNKILYSGLDNNDGALYGWNRLFCLGDSNNVSFFHLSYPMSSCDTPQVVYIDSIQSDSISGVAIGDAVYIIRNTIHSPNLLVYDTTTFSLIDTITLNFPPRFISLYLNKIGIAGINSSNSTEILILDNTLAILRDTVLGPEFNNPVSFDVASGFILASSPLDTAVYALEYSDYYSTFTKHHVYSGSGTTVCVNRQSELFFQPMSDTSSNNYDRQIFRYQFYNFTLTNQNIDKKISKIIGSPLSLVEDIPNSNQLFRFDPFNLIYDSIITGHNPVFRISDFRCPPISVNYDDSKVEWKIYPNPATDNTNLLAAGLICGREYKMDITDVNGKVLYESTIHAKMNVLLPIDTYPDGIYFVRIHTLKGLITKKIIKS